MASGFDIDAILSGTERRTLRSGHGQGRAVEMSRLLWTGFDDLLGIGYTEDQLIGLATHGNPISCPTLLGNCLGDTVMAIQKRRCENDHALTEFHKFCARQPRTDTWIRRIECEAARLKASRARRR